MARVKIDLDKLEVEQSVKPSSQNVIKLTSHKDNLGGGKRTAGNLDWGNSDPQLRQPVSCGFDEKSRNAMGSHMGSYMVYRALAVARGALNADHRPDLTNTAPAVKIGPFPSWGDPSKIVALDPWGAEIQSVFSKELESGQDVRPTIAITKAHINIPELHEKIKKGILKKDGVVVKDFSNIAVTKCAVEPVWWLPGVAKRFGVAEADMRRALFEESGGMFPELVTRHDLQVFLPPIGGCTVYLFGDPTHLGDPSKKYTVRVHDECNGSDVFGSDICTCRPYLVQGMEEAARTAQEGGIGVIVYFRKEGRSLGEVTKFLVYNARKRQPGGDSADKYFARTECVAGVQDMRFQELMPDVLHWLGITRIDKFVSMSDMKYNNVVNSGIEIVERVAIPEDEIPEDARVEIDAKIAAGYFNPHKDGHVKDTKKTIGKSWDI